MVKGVNKTILVGNVGRDPESKILPNGSTISKFSLCTNKTIYNKQTKEKTDRTTWHNVVAFGRLADIVKEYVRKGEALYLEGEYVSNTYETASGEKRTSYQVVMSEMNLIGGAKSPQGGNQAPVDDNIGNKTDDFATKDDIPF